MSNHLIFPVPFTIALYTIIVFAYNAARHSQKLYKTCSILIHNVEKWERWNQLNHTEDPRELGQSVHLNIYSSDLYKAGQLADSSGPSHRLFQLPFIIGGSGEEGQQPLGPSKSPSSITARKITDPLKPWRRRASWWEPEKLYSGNTHTQWEQIRLLQVQMLGRIAGSLWLY